MIGMGYVSLILHTLALIWHIVWFAVGVTVALWVEVLPSVWTTVLNYTLRPLNILIAIVRPFFHFTALKPN